MTTGLYFIALLCHVASIVVPQITFPTRRRRAGWSARCRPSDAQQGADLAEESDEKPGGFERVIEDAASSPANNFARPAARKSRALFGWQQMPACLPECRHATSAAFWAASTIFGNWLALLRRRHMAGCASYCAAITGGSYLARFQFPPETPQCCVWLESPYVDDDAVPVIQLLTVDL